MQYTNPSTSSWQLVKDAGPIVLVLGTGLVYLCGYWVRYKYLFEFGLTEGVISPSFQEVLAFGYPAIIMLLILSAVLTAVAFKLVKSQISGERSRTLFICAMYIIYTAWTPGLVSSFYGKGKASEKRSLLKDCDAGCFGYVLKDRCFVGVIIIQDTNRIFLLTRNSVMPFKVDELLRIVKPDDLKNYRPCRRQATSSSASG